jgi:hypothetical protein
MATMQGGEVGSTYMHHVVKLHLSWGQATFINPQVEWKSLPHKNRIYGSTVSVHKSKRFCTIAENRNSGKLCCTMSSDRRPQLLRISGSWYLGGGGSHMWLANHMAIWAPPVAWNAFCIHITEITAFCIHITEITCTIYAMTCKPQVEWKSQPHKNRIYGLTWWKGIRDQIKMFCTIAESRNSGKLCCSLSIDSGLQLLRINSPLFLRGKRKLYCFAVAISAPPVAYQDWSFSYWDWSLSY